MSGADFCRFCGASIPHRDGEGRCPHCQHHATLFYQEQARSLSSKVWAPKRRTDDMGNWPDDWSCP